MVTAVSPTDTGRKFAAANAVTPPRTNSPASASVDGMTAQSTRATPPHSSSPAMTAAAARHAADTTVAVTAAVVSMLCRSRLRAGRANVGDETGADTGISLTLTRVPGSCRKARRPARADTDGSGDRAGSLARRRAQPTGMTARADPRRAWGVWPYWAGGIGPLGGLAGGTPPP